MFVETSRRRGDVNMMTNYSCCVHIVVLVPIFVVLVRLLSYYLQCLWHLLKYQNLVVIAVFVEILEEE